MISIQNKFGSGDKLVALAKMRKSA